VISLSNPSEIPMDSIQLPTSTASNRPIRSFKRVRSRDSSAEDRDQGRFTLSPPSFSPLTPSTSAFPPFRNIDYEDIITCFRSSPEASDLLDAADPPPEKVRFWPNRGSTRARSKIANKYGVGTIWELPPSTIVSASKNRRTITKDDVRGRL